MRSPHPVTIFACFAFGYLLSFFFRSSNAVIAGDLTRELGLGADQLGFMTSLFYAGFALTQVPLGIALDRYGPRYSVPILMLSGVAGCLIMAGAPSFEVLALGRTLLGVGMAGGLMGSIKAFGAWFPAQRVATITGVLVGIGATGGLLATAPLAWVNTQIGWRAIFLFGAGIILISAALIAGLTRNAPAGQAWPQPQRGQALQSLGVILREPRFWRMAPLYFCILGVALSVQTLWGGPLLIDVFGMHSLEAGNMLLVMSIGTTIGYFACGWLSDRYGAHPTAIGAAILFLIGQGILYTTSLQAPLILIAVGYAIFGFSGAFNLVMLTSIRTLFPTEMSGQATTALNTFGFGGIFVLQWCMGIVISAFPRTTTGVYPAEAYGAAFILTLILTILALAWYIFPMRQPIAPTIDTHASNT